MPRGLSHHKMFKSAVIRKIKSFIKETIRRFIIIILKTSQIYFDKYIPEDPNLRSAPVRISQRIEVTITQIAIRKVEVVSFQLCLLLAFYFYSSFLHKYIFQSYGYPSRIPSSKVPTSTALSIWWVYKDK